MKKHTTAAGPTGTRRLRSLVAFRHQSPAARLLSTLVAFAIAMLLVAGTSPAQADDTAPAPADTTVATDAPAPDPATSTDAPADTPSDPPADTGGSTGGSATDAPTDAPAGAPSKSDGASTDATGADSTPSAPTTKSGPMMTTLKKMATAAATPNAVVPCGDSDANYLIGGFEIDGDECVANHVPALNGIDWAGIDTSSPNYGVRLDKFVDDGDTSGFQGSSKALTDPLTWSKGPAPNDKSDIERVRVYSQKFGNDIPQHTFSDFAIDRHPDDGGAGGTGTVTYDVEYNQLSDVLSTDKSLLVPQRSPGDLWFVFDQQGNNSLDYISGWKFSNSNGAGCKAVDGGGYWCPLTGIDFQGETSDDGAFAEGTLDISDAFAQGVCFTFGVTNVRTRTSNTDTTAFKDYIAPINAITSNCGSLVITKSDADTEAAVGGAVFQVVGDPRPDGDGAGIDGYQLCVYDGPSGDLAALVAAHPELENTSTCDELIADGAKDGTVTFDPVVAGSYTVTEIVPPPGYMLNGDATDTWTGEVVDGQPTEAPFANRRIWQPLSITKDAAGTFGATYHWKINKLIAPTADGPWSDETTAVDNGWLKKVVQAGDDTHLFYKLVVTEDGVDTSNYVVTGTIHVDNPNPDTFPGDGAMAATLTESLDGCSLDSTSETFPVDVSVPSGGADFAYTCDLGNGPVDEPLTNTATVTWDMNDYPQATSDLTPDTDADHYTDSADSDPFSFVETAPVNKTVTITDDTGDLTVPWTLEYGVDGPSHTSEVYKYDPAPDPGTCSSVITNTATVVGDGEQTATDGDGHDAVDSENGQVCVEDDLTAAVTNVHESLTRTFVWDIHKSTTTPPPATITVQNGQATAHYVVNVEALPYVDSNWAMSGTVHITNPNDFTAKQVSTLDIAYAGGGTCAPNDPALPDIAAGGFADVAFTCDFGDPAVQPDYAGDVTATVKWDGDAQTIDADSATVAEADWVITPVDEFVKVFDDHAVPGVEDPLFGGTQLRWQDVFDSVDPAAHQVEVEYDHTFSGSILPAAGSCKDLTNTAWLIDVPGEVILSRAAAAPENALASDDATVRVCTPAVVVSPPTPPEVSPPGALPNTGGPDAWVLAAGLVLLLGGSSLVIGDRRRRRRS
jgi:LPXTG-motif cell wall-anchored protein